MSIVGQEFIGNYRKLRQFSGIVYGAMPRKLNQNPNLFGVLENKLDLNIGKESLKDEGAGEKLETILMFIEEYARRKGNDCLREVLDCDFVSNRNLLVTIAMSAFEKNKFEFQAIRHKDVIFLCKIEIQEWECHQNGYKFEQYMTLDENGEVHDPQTPVSNAEQDKVVMKTKLKKNEESIKLCYGAEVDAVDSDNKYVELKTVSGSFSKYWFDNRSMKLFLQSYFGNIPMVLVGHQKGGFVHEISKLETSSIPNMSNQIKWNPEKCIEKLFDVLDQVKWDLEENGMARCYKFNHDKLKSESINPRDCDFVGENFLEQFV